MSSNWFDDDEEKPQRRKIGKTEWIAKKKILGNKCVICKQPEYKVGILEKAHIKAHSKGGSEVLPMCKNCHYRYDKGKLTSYELKKIGLSAKTYKGLIPKKPKRRRNNDDWWF